MQITKLAYDDIDDALRLFNDATSRLDFLYEKLSKDQFLSKFVTSTNNYDIYTYVAKSNAKIVGFISGVYDKETKKAYVTMIVVDSKFQHQGVGSKLLGKLEEVCLQQDLNQKKIEVVFFNPINLSWIIPNTKAVHPNAPGVDWGSIAYVFFKHHGYVDFAVQNVYYMDIKNYEFGDNTKTVIESVKEKGFKFDYLDISSDYGLVELLNDLGNPVWKKTIIEHVDNKGRDNTLLVPTFNHKIVGFTGPLIVESNGRGYFAGIGTHSEFRGFGLGKALFAKLVMGLKELGADYMTLFTGENNPARRMYEKEGFKIVRTYIDLRKGDFK